MQNPPPDQAGKSSTGLDANLAALLSYVFGWLSGLIFFLIEKESKFVKFHAMQSILFNVLVAVVAIGITIVMMIIGFVASQISSALGAIVGLLVGLIWLVFCVVLLVAWVLCLVKAYQYKTFKLPFIGDFAEKIANK